MLLPLQRVPSDPDQAWGLRLKVDCTCGQQYQPEDKKCPKCRTKNHFVRLLKKRKKIDLWLDRRIQKEVIPLLEKSQVFREYTQRFHLVLSEIIRNPVPKQQKKENINDYTKRLNTYCQSMLKTTSPKQTALGVNDNLHRSAPAMNTVAWTESHIALREITSSTFPSNRKTYPSTLDQRVVEHLFELLKPYTEALQTLQLSHGRMLKAYKPVMDILQRTNTTGGFKGLINKVRSAMGPIGNFLSFNTVIWKDDAEKEALKRFDNSIQKFIEQAKWFLQQHEKLVERNNLLFSTYKLSLRRFCTYSLAEHTIGLNPEQGLIVIKNVLSQKGIGSWLWRMFFSK
jgi:hypothetical protein